MTDVTDPPGGIADGRRGQILAIAAAALAEKGFDGARLRDVSNAAGVSIGLIQHHFETRDQLFLAAFEWSIDALLDRWHSSADEAPDPVARLEALIGELAGDPELVRRATTWIEFCASATRHPELRPGVLRVYDAWRTVIAEVVDAGVASGDFTLAMERDAAIELLSTLVDGLDLGAAGGWQDKESYAWVVRTSAALALGCPRLGTEHPPGKAT